MGVHVTIQIEGDRAIFRGAITPTILAAYPILEGHKIWSKDRRSFRFDATAFNLGVLQNAAPGVDLIQPGGDMAAAFAPASGPPVASPWQSRTTPMQHQKDAEDWVGTKNAIALFMEQGTGKTKVLIDWSHHLFSTQKITGHLVISKKGAHQQWIEEEYPKHYAGEFIGQAWPFKNIDQRLLSKGPELRVMSANWDAFRSKGWNSAVHEFVRAHEGKLLITADESQEAKNKKSIRHKGIDALKPYSSHRALASGTPIAVDLTDEWAQLSWLDETILGMKYITTFRRHYCIMGGFQGKQVIGHSNIKEFRKRTAPHVFRVTKEEIGMAPPQTAAWRFDLLPDQLRMIGEIRKDLETRIDSGETITASTVLVTFGKMAQIASGIIIDENKKVHHLMPLDKNPRIIRMLEWLDWVGDQRAIIWHRFTAERFMIAEALKSINAPMIDYAGLKPDEWAERKDEFRTPGGRLVLFGNPQSGLGAGQNLQGACNNALYHSHSDRLIDRLQSQDRINRIGTKGIVTFSDLVARKSPDIRMLGNNARKRGIADMALSGLRDLLRDMAENS